MGRLIILAGILLIAVSIAVFSRMDITPLAEFNPTTNFETVKATLCRSGERLVQESGEVSFSSGSGYSSDTIFSCEDAEGTRRDVTADFAEGMMGSVFEAAPQLVTSLAGGTALCGLGMMLLFIGLIVAVVSGGRKRSEYVTIPNTIEKPKHASSSVNDQLRELEEAHRNGLISEAEYERLRQQILDSAE